MAEEKIKCTSCGDLRSPADYYYSNSPFHKSTGKLHSCKKCIWTRVENQYENLILIKDTLRSLDKPFLMTLWNDTIQEALKSNKDMFKLYMKNLGLRQYRDLTWADSDFQKQDAIINASMHTEEDIEIPEDEVKKYWGSNYSDWEYNFLENERYNLMSSFECPDYGMEMIMKDICFINLDIEKVRQERKEGSAKIITNLIKTRSDLMNDANMKPIQSTGAEGNDQITFGTLIKKWENEKPVPKPLEDEMKDYIDTFMVGHLAKMEGLNNELTEKYDKALSQYTINFDEINKDDEEFED